MISISIALGVASFIARQLASFCFSFLFVGLCGELCPRKVPTGERRLLLRLLQTATDWPQVTKWTAVMSVLFHLFWFCLLKIFFFYLVYLVINCF